MGERRKCSFSVWSFLLLCVLAVARPSGAECPPLTVQASYGAVWGPYRWDYQAAPTSYSNGGATFFMPLSGIYVALWVTQDWYNGPLLRTGTTFPACEFPKDEFPNPDVPNGTWFSLGPTTCSYYSSGPRPAEVGLIYCDPSEPTSISCGVTADVIRTGTVVRVTVKVSLFDPNSLLAPPPLACRDHA